MKVCIAGVKIAIADVRDGIAGVIHSIARVNPRLEQLSEAAPRRLTLRVLTQTRRVLTCSGVYVRRVCAV